MSSPVGYFFIVSLISIAGHASEVEEGVAPEESPCAWCEHMKWAAIAGIALGWPPILKKAWKALTNKFLDINMLMSLAVIGAICIDEYVEGAVIVFCLLFPSGSKTALQRKPAMPSALCSS